MPINCTHRRCIGPVACPMPPGHPDAVGVWRWVICENCGAIKQWDYRDFPVDHTTDERLDHIVWRIPDAYRT